VISFCTRCFSDCDVLESYLSSYESGLISSPSSQRHQIFQESSYDLVETSHRVESQELSSHFESLVGKVESMSIQMNFDIFPMFFATK